MLVLAAAGGVLAVPAGLVGWAGGGILLSAYAVGVAASRPVVVVSVSATAAAFVVAATLVAYGWWQGLAPMALAAMPVGAAVGDAVRSRRALAVALEERARRAEEAAELESERRVAQERLRIARDVHDLVAHHIAVMNVQAAVAAQLLQSRPRAAAEALDHVGTAGRAVLDDLGTLLGLLRESGDQDLRPTPGLADLERLIDSAAAAGLRVERTTQGSPRPLPAAVEVSAYRVVQEALTNAHKHGTGSAPPDHRLTAATILMITAIAIMAWIARAKPWGRIGDRGPARPWGHPLLYVVIIVTPVLDYITDLPLQAIPAAVVLGHHARRTLSRR
ncbi:hypothetical protein GCM10009555_008660 [Acrocarpospora macrocephala]|uniref:histidine kinase n=1 Tax=Acrocarpospora macrocephala TaxID=150177 RepID=A0A5M3X5B8_9ACTN|nr:hypothetical protein Amac_084480 [Acrocarpospora macrocephala]